MLFSLLFSFLAYYYDSVAAYTGYVNITREKSQLSIFKTDIEKARPIVERFKLRFYL